MTVTINIPDRAETRLKQEADRTGKPITSLIEDMVALQYGPRDIDAFIDAIAAHSDELQTLPSEATTRASIYSGSE